MTKIYLVTLEAWNTTTNSTLRVLLQVFTNKKKAEIYAEFKKLYFETEKPSYIEDYEEITCKVNEYSINTFDYSKELLELKIKNLPY